MTWHPEALALRQQRVLAQVGPFLTQRGFYLAGGTAVALHLGHRRSVDLDWFMAGGIPDPLHLAQDLREQGVAFVTGQVAPGTLHGSVRGVRLGLLEYRYPLLAPLRPWRGGIRIVARADLAAMKLAAVAQRGAKKDFVDVYALGSRSGSLRQMLRWYQEKYTVSDLAHVLYGLAYFDDADRERMPRMLWDVTWRTMKETIRRWLRDVTRSWGN
ncbi:MAG TPA: nucleotidyl transferase AbiEii/AbiGii toxin family protein [Gemmataceae bacterium]|nr:nucleotidyl transferase AbiEii/AbiGii toxin family protein [Gemmataceae bacterium]